jgi:hypothetical protein
MTRPAEPQRSLGRRVLALLGVISLLAAMAPAAVMARGESLQRYVVVFGGDYALDGSYALGSGYALVGQYALDGAYALDDAYALGGEYALDGQYALSAEYALGRQYALYALDNVYALARDYALQTDYALDQAYALFGEYALESGYALDANYALGAGYALAQQYALTGHYALDDAYALTRDSTIYALDGSYALADEYALYALRDTYALGDNYALARDYALWLVEQAGGVVVSDLSRQLGVMVVDSKNAAFAETMSGYALVDGVGLDFGWHQFPTLQQAVASGALTIVNPATLGTALGGDPLESQQWAIRQIRADQSRELQAGSPKVSVGIVDTGIDGGHADFVAGGNSNVDCGRGADFTAQGPGIGNPFACVDNNFHGTHVAGIVAARANGLGVVGVAPNVTLVPIKVCDADGHCYASDVVEGLTYAGDLALNVINMSFYVDDDAFQQSTEFKCRSDSQQYAFRQAVQRAITYARGQGVTPIAAAGNSNTNLDNPPGGNCKVVPAQTDGVTAVSSIGPESGKAYYSSYGKDIGVAAPGGDFLRNRDAASGQTICDRQVLSTLPGNLYGCFQGTSMASPHAAGVAALIASQFGKADKNGRWTIKPSNVAARLGDTAVDIGANGRDRCYGHGRVDALRAVTGDTSTSYDPSAPTWQACPLN